MNEVVLFDVQDDVAVLTFNRPDRLNAWIPELQTRYFDLLDECAERDDVRAIVLTGGKDLCWYGERSVEGIPRLRALVDRWRGPR